MRFRRFAIERLALISRLANCTGDEPRRCRRRLRLLVVFLSIVVVAGCASAPSQSSRTSAASASGNAELVTAKVLVQSVAASGTLDIPLAFEQSSEAVVTLYTESESVSASIGGLDLAVSASSAQRALEAVLTSPSDGTLHVTNSSGSVAQVSLVVTIQSSRSLTVTTSSSAYSHGAQVSLDVVLTEPDPADSPVAQLVGPSGDQAPITLTKVDAGHWTGQATPSAGGDYSILASVSGTRPRYAGHHFTVASGSVSLGSGFAQRLVDTDGDGLANQLILSPTVTVATSGTYSVVGTLVDASGSKINVAGGDVALTTGSQPFDLVYSGSVIYDSKKSGPYRLINVSVLSSAGVVEARASDMGQTDAYDYHQFQHRP